MADIKNEDGFVSQGYHYRQDHLGTIKIDVLHYDHCEEHSLDITVYRHIEGGPGYGDKVFTGTLAELISRLEVKP